MPGDKKDILKALKEEQKRLKESESYYLAIESALTRVRKLGQDIGESVSALDKYFDASGNFVHGQLKKDTDPKIVADDLRKVFKSKEDYESKLKEKDQELKGIELGKKQPGGQEAIIKAYAAYLKKKNEEEGRHLSETEALEMATQLYARNNITHRQWRIAENTMDDPNVFRTPHGLAHWPLQQGKELLTGSQESFVCNLAESPAIGKAQLIADQWRGPFGSQLPLNPFRNPNFAPFKRTRRLGFLWRKHNARPPWGSMNYSQLMVCYYALRDAVRKGNLNNTSYLRAQRNEITRLLLDEFSQNLMRDFKLTDATSEEEKKREEATPTQEATERQIRLLLAGDPPNETVKTLVTEALAHAEKKTGRIRKAIGRGSAATAKGVYTYGVRTPVVYAGRGVAWPVKKSWGGARAIGSWFWGKATEKKTFWGGGSGGGH